MQPSCPTNHGHSTATVNPVRSNLVKPGRFGLLFPELANFPWTTGSQTRDDEVARELAKAMHAATNAATPGTIPAGFTYFGQFVDHDITFDPTILPDGVALSDDPLLPARSAGYSSSFQRRALETPGPSAVGRVLAGKEAR